MEAVWWKNEDPFVVRQGRKGGLVRIVKANRTERLSCKKKKKEKKRKKTEFCWEFMTAIFARKTPCDHKYGFSNRLIHEQMGFLTSNRLPKKNRYHLVTNVH